MPTGDRVYFVSKQIRRGREMDVEDCRYDLVTNCWIPTGITEKVYLHFFEENYNI